LPYVNSIKTDILKSCALVLGVLTVTNDRVIALTHIVSKFYGRWSKL